MLYLSENFCEKLPKFEEKDAFLGCNFSQPIAHTRILPEGLTQIVFVSCCMRNCEVPEEMMIDCLHFHEDIVAEPIPPELTSAQRAVQEVGADALLDAIGITAVELKWKLQLIADVCPKEILSE